MSKKKNLGDLITNNKENAEKLAATDIEVGSDKDKIEKISKLIFENKQNAEELSAANKIIAAQEKEIKKQATDLIRADKEKEKHRADLLSAKKELVLSTEKAKHAVELTLINKELTIQITERKQSEEKLKISELRYRDLFQQANEGLLIMTPDGQFSDLNQAFAQMHGYTVDELKNYDIRKLDVLGEKTLDDRADHIGRILAGEVVRFEVEHYHKDGHIFPLSITVSLINIGGKQFFMAFHQDITELKKLENERKKSQEKLRSFAAMLQQNREQERKSIAREIHDEFGQVLTAIKMNLTMLGNESTKTLEPSGAASIMSEIDNMKYIIDQTIHKVRVFTNKLRPDVLDTFGLIEALDAYISEFGELYSIECTFKKPEDEIRVDMDQSIAVYRIVQEALTNVARHAKATEVDIFISKQDNFLNVSIKDNGKGMERTQLDDAKSFGIIGMKERAYICGGSLTVSSRKKNGTRIELTIPLKEND